MRITCIGIDPAGLYLGIRLKRANPAHEVCFIGDANPAATHGSSSLPTLVCNPLKPRWQLKDAQAHAVLDQDLVRFDRVAVKARDRQFETQGLSFASIDSAALLRRLRDLAGGLGCRFEPATAPVDPAQFPDSDLVVLADGPHSATRDLCGKFEASPSLSRTKHAVFALDKGRDGLAYAFCATAAGIFHTYAVPRGADASSLVVEAPAQVIRASGLDEAPAQQILAFCRGLFPDELAGASASEGETAWREFVTVRNRNWHAGKLVVLGSAAYTAHFSVGLELRSWLEDAETLAECLGRGSSLADALGSYEAARRPQAESLQRAALTSLAWFESTRRYIDKPFEEFVFSLLTNNMRINYPRLAKAAPALARALDELAAGEPPGSNRASPPPMLAPYRLRELVLPNRIALSPMCMYSATDGTVNDFHLVHLAAARSAGPAWC